MQELEQCVEGTKYFAFQAYVDNKPVISINENLATSINKLLSENSKQTIKTKGHFNIIKKNGKIGIYTTSKTNYDHLNKLNLPHKIHEQMEEDYP